MSKRLGIAILLLVVLAAVSPFFHTDDHPADCAVCSFVAAGNAQLTPACVEFTRPVLDFCGLAAFTVDSYLASGAPVRGSRAPPIVL